MAASRRQFALKTLTDVIKSAFMLGGHRITLVVVQMLKVALPMFFLTLSMMGFLDVMLDLL